MSSSRTRVPAASGPTQFAHPTPGWSYPGTAPGPAEARHDAASPPAAPVTQPAALELGPDGVPYIRKPDGRRNGLVETTTGPGGVVRKSIGLAVGELGVGSVIYAQRQHAGYLPANGAVYSRAAYPTLRATIGTVPDGAGTWTARTSAADNGWFSVCWSSELSLFCAVSTSGTGNRVMTSPDGITWTPRTSAADNQWYEISWSPELSLFCAVAVNGVGNRVMTSPDGITWTARTSAADNQWFSVCWSPELSLFCAVAGSGTGSRVMTNAPAATYNPSTHFKLPSLPNATSGEARAFIYAGA